MFKKTIALLLATALPFQTMAAQTPRSLKPAASSQRVSFNQLAEQCGSTVHPDTLQAVARVESKFNPFVIGVVGGALKKQPETLGEAVAAANKLHREGRNFSMGLMQINKKNLAHFGLNYETVFHPCKNVATGAAILQECFKRAGGATQAHLQKAFSCYYSGNFGTGFKADFKGQPPYVVKILNAARENNQHQLLAYNVPAVNPVAPLAAPGRTGKISSAIPVTPSVYVNRTPPTNAQAVKTVHAVAYQPEQRQPEIASYDDVPNTPPSAEAPPAKPRAAWDVFGEFWPATFSSFSTIQKPR